MTEINDASPNKTNENSNHDLAKEINAINGEIVKKRLIREHSLIEPMIRNPFVHKIKFGWLNKLMIGFNGLILLPIRILSIIVLLLVATLLGAIMVYGISSEELRKTPLFGWRRKLKSVLRLFGRAITFCCGFHHIRKNGIRASRSEAPIFVAAPHSTFFDTFVFFILGLPYGVSRSANEKIPLLGFLVKALQPISVTREDSKNKLAVINEIKNRSKPDSIWPDQVLVFPEGTTTNRSCLITFKPGTFIPGLPVQPVVVEYKNKLDTITWTWEGLSALKCFFFTLCQFDNQMEITYLPVYYPNEEEKKDAKLYAKNVRNKMAEYLHVLTTNHTYEDCRLMLKARELNLPFESGLIEFDKLKEKLNINYENAAEVLLKFTNYAKKNGRMSLADFSKYLQLPPTGAVNQVFNMYDRDKDGHIDFREFLIGLSLLSQPASTEDTLKLAFKMFDSDGKGFITLTDLKSILYSALSMAPNEVEQLFHQIDSKDKNEITFDEFKSYIEQKPEYAKIFLVYNEIQMLRNNIEIEKIASSASSVSKEGDSSLPTTSSDDNNNNKNISVVDTEKTNYAKSLKNDEMTTIKRAKSRTDDDVYVEDVSSDNNTNTNIDEQNLRKKSSTPDETSKTE